MRINEHDLQRVSKQLGRRIQRIRKVTGLTQVELEERTEIYDVGAIERGEANPTLFTLLRLTTALNVQLRELFDIPSKDLSEIEKIRLETMGLLCQQDIAVQRKALELLKVFLS